MLNNIRKFDGWMTVDSYEDITIGKGAITLHVNSLKTMMEYMPIVEELDRRVNEINKFNKIVLMNSSSGRFNKVEEYDTRFGELLDMIGVFPNKLKFQARCRIYDYERNKSASMYLGNFSTPEEAFLIYKNFKENHIKEVANMYKRLIPIKLYEAMYKYKIEIND